MKVLNKTISTYSGAIIAPLFFIFLTLVYHSFEILMMWSKLIQFNNLRNKIEYLFIIHRFVCVVYNFLFLLSIYTIIKCGWFFKEKIHMSCIYHSLIFKRKMNMHEQCKIILYCQSSTTIIYIDCIFFKLYF
jgi:uncharacterized membrane protein YcgQ (UPF0703/DUF1980 family)